MGTSGLNPRAHGHRVGLRFEFTPAEWHRLLDDPAFLDAAENRSCGPRMLMGHPVTILPWTVSEPDGSHRAEP